MITQVELQEILSHRNDGLFVWLVKPSLGVNIGDVAGSFHKPTGYRRIKIKGKLYQEHRLVWLYYHGYMPTKMIDHINRDKSDNRIENLRLATRSENGQNRGKNRNNASGFKGVCKNGNNWKAKITINGIDIHLGTFTAIEEAVSARQEAELKYHPFNP